MILKDLIYRIYDKHTKKYYMKVFNYIKNIFSHKDLLDKPIFRDEETNLIWQQELAEETFTWNEAIKYAKKLNKQRYGNITTWRVPTCEELYTIITDIPLENKNYNCSKTVYSYIKEPLLNSIKLEFCHRYWSISELKNSDNKDEDVEDEFYDEIDFACYVELDKQSANYFDKKSLCGIICVSGHYDIKNIK